MNRSKASTGATVEFEHVGKHTATSGASKATSWAVNDLSGM
jgi:hypothetical protein